MRSIYLDNSTVTKPSERAISRMLPFLTEKWGSPYQLHPFCQKIIPDLEEASRSILSLVGGGGHFVFASSHEEAVNRVIHHAYFEGMVKTGKNQILTTSVEMAPFYSAIDKMQTLGVKGRFVSLGQDGLMSEESLIDAMTPRTLLLSLSLVNGLTGVMQKISEIATVCEERGVWLHLDVTHALGKMEVNFENTGATFLTFGGEAIHAPLGTAGVIIKEGVPFSSLVTGSLEQAGIKGGAFNPGLLIALSQAAIEAKDAEDYLGTEIARLRDLFELLLTEALPEVKILFKEQRRAPHISSFVVPHISSEAFSFALSQAGVYLTFGGGAFQTLSSLLSSLSYPREISQSALSASLCRETTDEEIRRAVKTIKEVYVKYQPLLLEPS